MSSEGTPKSDRTLEILERLQNEIAHIREDVRQPHPTDKKRDWLDFVDIIGIPLVLAIFGSLGTYFLSSANNNTAKGIAESNRLLTQAISDMNIATTKAIAESNLTQSQAKIFQDAIADLSSDNALQQSLGIAVLGVAVRGGDDDLLKELSTTAKEQIKKRSANVKRTFEEIEELKEAKLTKLKSDLDTLRSDDEVQLKKMANDVSRMHSRLPFMFYDANEGDEAHEDRIKETLMSDPAGVKRGVEQAEKYCRNLHKFFDLDGSVDAGKLADLESEFKCMIDPSTTSKYFGIMQVLYPALRDIVVCSRCIDALKRRSR